MSADKHYDQVRALKRSPMTALMTSPDKQSKSRIYTQKSRIYTQKSPIYTQKRPIHLYTSSMTGVIDHRACQQPSQALWQCSVEHSVDDECCHRACHECWQALWSSEVAPKKPYDSTHDEPWQAIKEPYIHSKEPCIHSKEPYIHSKEAYTLVHKPYDSCDRS